jgi:HlyD family secretion protein
MPVEASTPSRIADMTSAAVPTPRAGGATATSGRVRRLALVAVGVAAALTIAVYVWRGQNGAAKEYVTIPVSTGAVVPTVIASGAVNPVTTVQVGSYVSGVIQSLSCDFNTKVRAGQLCAKIDPRPYQTVVEQESANLATARAQLEKDRANLSFAKLIYERDADLLQRNIVSQETVDNATNAYRQAQSQIALDEAALKQRQAALDAARINLGYTNIVSPVDGTVVSRNVTQGQTVAASFQTPTLFLIATDLTKMQVDANVSESDIGRVAQGNAATFTVEAFPDRQFSGVVGQIRQAPQSVQNVVTYDVVVSVANRELLLKPGMTASVHIVTARHDHVLRVPDAALRYAPSAGGQTASADAAQAGRGAHVWVLQGSTPHRVPIVVGLDDDSFSELLQGELHDGDPVIVSERSGAAAPAGGAQSGPRLPRL